METTCWKTVLTTRRQRLKIEVTSGPKWLLTASLPYPPKSALALRCVLEGLALWQDRVLYTVCAAGDTAEDGIIPGCVDGHPYVPHSPLVDVVVRPRDLHRGCGEGGRGGLA